MRRAIRAKVFLLVVILALVAASVAYLMDSPNRKNTSRPVKQVRLEDAEVLIDGFRFTKGEAENGGLELTAKSAKVKKDSGKASLDDLHATYRGKDGTVLKLSADKGVFDTNTKNVKLDKGQNAVTVTSSAGYKMTAGEVHWDDKKKELSSKDKVDLSGKNIRIEGKGLVADTETQKVRITDGVKTVFNPSR